MCGRETAPTIKVISWGMFGMETTPMGNGVVVGNVRYGNRTYNQCILPHADFRLYADIAAKKIGKHIHRG